MWSLMTGFFPLTQHFQGPPPVPWRESVVSSLSWAGSGLWQRCTAKSTRQPRGTELFSFSSPVVTDTGRHDITLALLQVGARSTLGPRERCCRGQRCANTWVPAFSRVYPQLPMLNRMVTLCVTFGGRAELFSKAATPFPIPTGRAGGCRCPPVRPNTARSCASRPRPPPAGAPVSEP